jgi:hypothetical protein
MISFDEPLTESATLEMISAEGKLVYSENLREGINTASISPALASGLYVIRITENRSGKMWVRKIQLTEN